MFYDKVLILVWLISTVYCQDKLQNLGIVGGHTISITDAPYVVGVHQVGVGLVCGGSIVRERFILTAAHCFQGKYMYRNYTAVVGTDKANTGGDVYAVEKIIPHRKFDIHTMNFDICLIKLKTPIKFGLNVQSIDLIDDKFKFNSGMMFNVSGWGRTGSDDSMSMELRQVLMPYVTPRACKIHFPNLTRTQFCAGESGKDTCEGDSGGPLTWNDKLVGITSYGLPGCGIRPGVYTKIKVLLNWIEHTIARNSK